MRLPFQGERWFSRCDVFVDPVDCILIPWICVMCVEHAMDSCVNWWLVFSFPSFQESVRRLSPSHRLHWQHSHRTLSTFQRVMGPSMRCARRQEDVSGRTRRRIISRPIRGGEVVVESGGGCLLRHRHWGLGCLIPSRPKGLSVR